MARVLVLTRGIPDDLAHGLFLRVHYLCVELSRRHACCLLAFTEKDPASVDWDSSPYSDVGLLPPMPNIRSISARHFRLSNGRMLERYAPDYYGSTVAAVASRVREWNIDVVVSFAPGLAEIAMAQQIPRVLDVPDCLTLTAERRAANLHDRIPLTKRLRMRLEHHRIMRGERDTVRGFDVTMTVSPPDRQRLMEISGLSAERIVFMPNGAPPHALSVRRRTEPAGRSVVFWGNLGFRPNAAAVHYFNDNVFQPHLADRGIEWYIVGRDATPDIEALSRHPGIHVEGFQPELFEYIADKGVMVNPMVEGSGIKNKVLEAFAVGLPVVSTSLGVDALSVESGEQCLIADSPRAFADSVLALLDDANLRQGICDAARAHVRQHFTWGNIGRRFSELIADLAGESTDSAAVRSGSR